MINGRKMGKGAAGHYLKTGTMGAYECVEIDWEEEQDGKYAPCYEDALTVFGADEITTERQMLVEGKAFRVLSLFPVNKAATPTDRMLRVIDADLEKEAHEG